MSDRRNDPNLRWALDVLLTGRSLSEDEAHGAFSIIMSGGAQEAQIGALLALMAQRGPTVEELAGSARVMREHVVPVPVVDEWREHLIDTCGTGGAPKRFNVSTAAALVAAGAGARVAKHGNRSRTGRGSAEVLEALGVNVNASPIVQARCLEEAGVCFSFAIHHHPAIHHAMPARRALGFPTIFNLLGPLTNPAGARRQLIGVYAPHLTELLARTLARLGSARALVVYGTDGSDELTTAAPTRYSHCHDGIVECGAFQTQLLALPGRMTGEESGVVGEAAFPTPADAAQAAVLLQRILDDADQDASPDVGLARDLVVLNAAAALVVADLASDLAEGVARADEAIASGAARRTLDRLIEVSNGRMADGGWRVRKGR